MVKTKHQHIIDEMFTQVKPPSKLKSTAADRMLRTGRWRVGTKGVLEKLIGAHTYYYSCRLRSGRSVRNKQRPSVEIYAYSVPEFFEEFVDLFPNTTYVRRC
jgi:hypothetical protein